MKGRAAPHHLRKLPRSRGPLDGSHLWRPGAGAAATPAGRAAEETRRVGAR